MNHITVVKIGGNVIDNPEALSRFVEDFAKLQGRKILIHGGGKEATRLSGRLGIETKMVDGRRVTDRDTLDVVTMVYAGLVNKRIVAMLQACGCDAVGLCGADAKAVSAVRRKPEPIDYGYVGDIAADGVNDRFIAGMLDSGLTPVFCAITYDGNGGLLNCNADSVASAVAVGASHIAPTDLCFCFEKAGVLEDIDNPDSVIRHITPEIYQNLKAEAKVSAGMLPKIDNAFDAIRLGVDSVIIKHSDDLIKESGTRITL